MDKRKQEYLESRPTEMLQRILDTLGAHEAADGPSEQYPLGGQIHIEGRGWFETKAIRAEVARRETAGA